MKHILKKVLLLCLFVTSAIAVGLFAACTDKPDDGGKDEDTTVIYTVTVENDEHTALKDVGVYLTKGTTRYDSVKTGADGKVTFELAPDTYGVSLVASTIPEGYHAPEDIQVTKDKTSATVTLIKDFRYTVKLVNEDGTPFYRENLNLAICVIGGNCLTPAPVGTDGIWTMTDVDPGDYKVLISFPEELQGQFTFTGSDEGNYYTGKHFSATDTEMTIVIKPVPKTEYTVTVLKPDNTPASGIYVNLTTSTSSLTPAQTGADGKAKITVPAYGEYGVTLTPPEGFAFDYGAYKTTEANHEITVKLLTLNTLELKTEMTAEEKEAYENGFTQFASSDLPIFYSFKNMFTAKETKYFAFTALKTDTYVIFCKAAGTTFTVCKGDNSNFTDGEKYSVETTLAQGISVTKDKIVYFSVTAATAGMLEFVIGTPDPNPSSEVTFTGADTKEITVGSATKFATVYFKPEESGVYEICSEGNFDTRVEYYANAISMAKTGEDDDSGEGTNFKIDNIEFQDSYLGGTSLFRVYVKEGATFPATFNVKITRTGDAEEEIVRKYEKVIPDQLGDKKFEEGTGVFTLIDLTTEQTLVKDDDGIYHVGTVDGPVLVAKLSGSFRNLGSFTDENEKGFVVTFIDLNDESKGWDYIDFWNAYTEKCNSDGVYPVNDEIKLMLQHWADEYINQYKDQSNSLFETLGIAEGNSWLIPCGYYAEQTPPTPPVEDDVIVGEYNVVSGQFVQNNEKYILTVNADRTYSIAEDIEDAEPIETGTWVKNSENNYTFTYVMGVTGTYTVTRDGETGKLTFMEDLEEPADEPYCVCETSSTTPPAEKDVIVGDYVFGNVMMGTNKSLTINEDFTFSLTEFGHETTGTWVNNQDGTYGFTINDEDWSYIVTRDSETGSLTFMDGEELAYEFEVDGTTPEEPEKDVIVGLYSGDGKTLTVLIDYTFEISDEMGTLSGTWVKNEDGSYTFTENNPTFGEVPYDVTRDEQGKLTFMDGETLAYEFEVYSEPAEKDVIVGLFTNDEELTLTVFEDKTYEITTENMMGITVTESGTWIKNSENNYTFTYIVGEMTGTYTVTRDENGTLTFMEDLEEPAETPYYVFEVSTATPEEPELDAILEGSPYTYGSYSLSVWDDGTFMIFDTANDWNLVESGKWYTTPEEGEYSFLCYSDETYETLTCSYTVTRDEQGKLTFMENLDEPVEDQTPKYVFEVSASTLEPDEDVDNEQG